MLLICWSLRGVVVVWMIYLTYLIVAAMLGVDLPRSPLRSALVDMLTAATAIGGAGRIAVWAVGRLESAVGASTPSAVELGRQLERLRDQESPSSVLPFARRPVGR